MKKTALIIISAIFLIGFSIQLNSQVKNIKIDGLVIDEFNNPVPFAAVTITNKNIGISTTEDGEFSLKVSNNEMEDNLSISSLGFKTFTIKVKDYLAQEEKKIILKEDVVEMDEITILPPKNYVVSALKKLKENTLNSPHVIEILYRRAATEEDKAKFFVENYIKFRSRGPAYPMSTIQVVQARKSADYRYWKRIQWRHSIVGMDELNPLRPNDSQHGRNIKKFKWTIDGETSYEGEEVLILQGQNPKKKWEKIRLYIGIDTYKVYRIERGNTLYIYKKHKSGKLVLNYFKNDWRFPKWNIPKHLHGTIAETLKYQVEGFVYNIETNKSKMRLSEFGAESDMGNLKLSYNANFWESLSLPPDTKFYKKIKKGLESNFGVPLEIQYNLVNR